MSDNLRTIEETISEIEKFSNVNGLDISFDVDSDQPGMMTVVFTKEAHCIDDDQKIVDECKDFITEVVIPLVLKHEEVGGSVDVNVEIDEDEDHLVYVNMTMPTSEYVVEAIKTYIKIAHSVDSFLSL